MRAAIICVSTGLAVLGCQEERGAIDRTQANVVDKSIFDGTWYYRQTVIDSPWGSPTFVGEQGELEKVRWEIEEDYLIARRAYEAIAGAEPEGIAGESEQGAAVAMWAIESHFD